MELLWVDLPFWRLTTLQHPSRHPEPRPGGGICRLFSSPTSWLCLAQATLPHHISCCYLMSWPSPWKQTDLIPHLGSHVCILSGPWLGKGRALVWGVLSTLLPGGDTPAAKAPSTPRLLGAGRSHCHRHQSPASFPSHFVAQGSSAQLSAQSAVLSQPSKEHPARANSQHLTAPQAIPGCAQSKVCAALGKEPEPQPWFWRLELRSDEAMAPLGMETELQGVQSHGRARRIAPPCFQRQQQGSSGQKQDVSVSFPY